MRYQLLHDDGTRTYMLVFDKGDQVVEELERFAAEENLSAAHFSGLGAVSSARVAFFAREKKDYEIIPIDDQLEVLHLTGNVARHEGEPAIHPHVVLGRRDGTTVGGHLMEATVWPTLEVTLVETPATLRRTLDEESGLPLLDV